MALQRWGPWGPGVPRFQRWRSWGSHDPPEAGILGSRDPPEALGPGVPVCTGVRTVCPAPCFQLPQGPSLCWCGRVKGEMDFLLKSKCDISEVKKKKVVDIFECFLPLTPISSTGFMIKEKGDRKRGRELKLCHRALSRSAGNRDLTLETPGKAHREPG